MLIDSFLFFQELDLLEIRLEYLYPIVDKFIIVEAKQTFKGSIKGYIFEKNIKRFTKFINKINYFKIEDIHHNYPQLKQYLKVSNSKVHKKILGFMEKHSFYEKENLSHVLDTYHRECIHLAFDKVCNDNDIIIFSDLDEIPSFNYLKNKKEEVKLDKFTVFIQHEFKYFLNNYANSNWYGSIVTPYKLLRNYSLNTLRFESKKIKSFSNSGYHFTSIGNKSFIINKIENWAHQEFNHKIIKDNVEENILNGKDIFYRLIGDKNKFIDIQKSNIIDERMSKILLKYENLIIKKEKSNIFFNIKYLYLQIKFNLIRARNKPLKFIRKIFKLIFSK